MNQSPEWMRVPTGDTHCAACGSPLSGTYWLMNAEARHTECVDWATVSRPPYSYRLREIRERYTKLRAELKAVERVGRLLAAAAKDWPKDGLEHAKSILEAMHTLDLRWPNRPPQVREDKGEPT